MKLLEVDVVTARRYILGLQGLWPGRRWNGIQGLHSAVQEIGSVQVDPLDVVGQSQDLALCARVETYRPSLLDHALYERRSLFEWGANLHIRPIEELPYMLSKMRKWDYQNRRASFERTHQALIAEVLRAVETRGPLGSRDLVGGERVSSYRARRDTGLALFYLWLRGDLMIHSRLRGERRYDLTSKLVQPRLLVPASPEDSEEHFLRRGMRLLGLPNASEMLMVQRLSSESSVRASQRNSWVHDQEMLGRLVRVKVKGWRGPHWADAGDAPLLERLTRGDVPKRWRPLSTTTEDEATFLAPLEIVSARGRSKKIFDFEYVWEVYKPAAKRRWGYYTLPILHGETLKARAELRFDREENALRVLDFWLEAWTKPSDQGFARAVARGLDRLRTMTGAGRVDLKGVRPSGFRSLVARGT